MTPLSLRGRGLSGSPTPSGLVRTAPPLRLRRSVARLTSRPPPRRRRKRADLHGAALARHLARRQGRATSYAVLSALAMAARRHNRTVASTATTRMATVFVSYSHVDKEIADTVADGLEKRGFGTWIDSKGLRIGASLMARIADAIEEGDFLLALVSEASRNSNWCRKEIALAMTRGINNRQVVVLPLRIGNVEMPAELKDTLWLDFDPAAIDAALNRVADDINKHLADRRGGAAPTAAAAR